MLSAIALSSSAARRYQRAASAKSWGNAVTVFVAVSEGVLCGVVALLGRVPHVGEWCAAPGVPRGEQGAFLARQRAGHGHGCASPGGTVLVPASAGPAPSARGARLGVQLETLRVPGVREGPNRGGVPFADEGRIDVLTRREQDVPQQTAGGVLVVAGRVRDEPDGRACEPGAGVGGRFGAVYGSTPCVGCTVSGVSTPVSRTVSRSPSASRTRMVSPSTTRATWAGAMCAAPSPPAVSADERSEHGCEAHDTCSSPHTGRRAPRRRAGSSIRSMSHAFLLTS